MGFLQQAFRYGVTVFATLTCPMFAYCRISSIPNIAKLTSSSPVIVVGEVLRVVRVGNGEIPMSDGKAYACASMAAFIRVDEVLKGEPANGTIEVDYLQNSDWEAGPLTNGLTEETYLMFFLKPDRDKFAFVASDQSSMPMSRSRTVISGNSDEDIYNRVLRHLGEGLFDEQASSQDRIRTIFVIDSEQSPIVQKMFKEALDAPAARSDRGFRFELLAALARHKDISILPEFETALLSSHDAALATSRSNMIYALQMISPSLSGPILIQALRLPESELRVAAAAALASAPSNEAIRALFGALDDPDIEVKGRAINSLTSLFHEPQCLPSGYAGEAFSACVEHWKDFATTHNVSRGSQDGPQDLPAERVEAIISRCLARGSSIVDGHTSEGRLVSGVRAFTWIPPTPEDYQEMASIGPDAIKPLSLLLDSDGRPFVKLLSVKFLTAIGGVSVFDALVRATNRDEGQVVRFTAMEGLAVSPNPQAMAIIQSLQTDEDAFIAGKAREIVGLRSESRAR
jgi:hypothetical protein